MRAGISKRVYPHLFRACSITHKQGSRWPESHIKSFHGLSKDSKVMKHYSHLSYNDLEEIQKTMNGLPVEDAAEMGNFIKCAACGRKNPVYAEVCSCGLPTEMKYVSGNRTSLESEIESRLEKKMQEFIESRQVYDKLMERFMSILLARSKQSPELMKHMGRIGLDLQKEQSQNVSTKAYHN